MKRKVTICALFYFVFKGKFQVHAMGTYIRSGDLTEGSFCVTMLGGGGVGGLIFGGAYFRNFTVVKSKRKLLSMSIFRDNTQFKTNITDKSANHLTQVHVLSLVLCDYMSPPCN